MALIVNKELDNGITGTYLVIRMTNINWRPTGLECRVDAWLYIDQAAEQAGKKEIATYAYNWSGKEFPFTRTGNIFEQAYEKLKSLRTETTDVDKKGNIVITPGPLVWEGAADA